jgi:hypothetical protein
VSDAARKRRPRAGRQQLHPYIAQDVYERLKAYCARRGLPDSGVVEVALREHLDQASEAALIMRRLDRIERRVSKVHRDLEMLCECFGVWVRLWFAHTPELPDSAKPAAQMSARKRFDQFEEFVAKRLHAGERLAVDLLGEDSPEPPGAPSSTDRGQESS